MTPTLANQFVARFKGGYRFCTADNCATGVQVNAGGTSWGGISDKNMKEDFRELDEEKILSDMSLLDLTSWVFKGQKDKSKRTIGPMAQDFYRLFARPYELNSSDTFLVQSDVTGVLLVGVKALEKRTSDFDKEMKILKMKMKT